MHGLDLLVNQQASQASDSLSPFVCGQVCAHMQACKLVKKKRKKRDCLVALVDYLSKVRNPSIVHCNFFFFWLVLFIVCEIVSFLQLAALALPLMLIVGFKLCPLP